MYSSILGNVSLFLSIISSDWEVFKDLILMQPTWKCLTAYICIYLQQTDYYRHLHRLREESRTRTFTLSAFPCSSEFASNQDRNQGTCPLTQKSCNTPPTPVIPQTWQSAKVTCQYRSERECKSRARSTSSKRQTAGVNSHSPWC